MRSGTSYTWRAPFFSTWLCATLSRTEPKSGSVRGPRSLPRRTIFVCPSMQGVCKASSIMSPRCSGSNWHWQCFFKVYDRCQHAVNLQFVCSLVPRLGSGHWSLFVVCFPGSLLCPRGEDGPRPGAAPLADRDGSDFKSEPMVSAPTPPACILHFDSLKNNPRTPGQGGHNSPPVATALRGWVHAAIWWLPR